MKRYYIEAVLIEGSLAVMELEEKRGDWVKYDDALREQAKNLETIKRLKSVLWKHTIILSQRLPPLKHNDMISDIFQEINTLINDGIIDREVRL